MQKLYYFLVYIGQYTNVIQYNTTKYSLKITSHYDLKMYMKIDH